MLIQQSVPDCNVLFFPYANEQTDFGPKDSDVLTIGGVVEAGPEILECTTSKPKGGVGTFSILLGSNTNWKGILHAGCWCLIFMSNQKLPDKSKLSGVETGGLKMVGIVRSVRRKEVTDPDTGVRSLRYLVSGEDFQSVFNTPIYINANLTAVAGGERATLENSLLLLGPRFENILSPSDMVDALMDSLLGRPAYETDGNQKSVSKVLSAGRAGQPFLVPREVAKIVFGFKDSGAAGDYFMGMITKFLQTNLIGQINVKSDISGTVTTWSLLQSYSHRILNEVYTDLLPVSVQSLSDTQPRTILSPSIVLRAVPFSTEKIDGSNILFNEDGGGKQVLAVRRSGKAQFATADTNTPPGTGSHFYVSRSIQEGEIMGFDSGKSDQERFNFFFVPSNLAGSTQPSEIDMLEKILASGGLNSISDVTSVSRYGLRPFIAYSNYMLGDRGDSVDIMNQIVRDLWHDAHLFENGTVTLAGTERHIPVGTNIEFAARGWRAHVERVDNFFKVVDPTRAVKAYRTNVSFTRLQNKDGTPVDAVEDENKTHKTGQFSDWDRGVTVQGKNAGAGLTTSPATGLPGLPGLPSLPSLPKLPGGFGL